jgi:hypothetical protein
MRQLVLGIAFLVSLTTTTPLLADCVVCGRFSDGHFECVPVDSFGANECREVRRGGCIARGIGDCPGADGPPECYNNPTYPGCGQMYVFNEEFRIEQIEIESTPAVAAMTSASACAAAL